MGFCSKFIAFNILLEKGAKDQVTSLINFVDLAPTILSITEAENIPDGNYRTYFKNAIKRISL